MEKTINPISVSSGKIIRHKNLTSKFIETRIVDVWIPKNYDQKYEYNLLVMHDGQLLFDSTNSWNGQEWCVDEWMTRLLEENRVDKTIVAGIWNSGMNRHTDYFPRKPLDSIEKKELEKIIKKSKMIKGAHLFNDGVKSDEYLKYIVLELIPFLEKNFSLKKNQKNRFIGGSSMGGLISLYAICEYPDVFYGAICMSTHWPGVFPENNEILPKAISEYVRKNLPSPKNHKLYFDYGSEGLDAYYEKTQNVINRICSDKDYDNKNLLSLHFAGHTHQEKAWAKRLNIPLEFMLKKT